MRDASVERWRADLRVNPSARKWGDPIAAMNSACDSVFKHAAFEMRKAEAAGKQLPIDFFFTLFTFANIDALAFEIEEALIPAPEKATGRIRRHPDAVRRIELLVHESVDAVAEPTAPA
jgi:hypothetical protein